MVKAANFQLYCLSRIKQCPTPEALRMAVYLLVSSRVDLLLDGLPKTQVNKLQHVINCAARMVLGVGRFKHVTPILESLHWLPVEYWIKFKVLCLAYKLLHGLAPAYLADLITPYVPKQSLRSAELNLLAVPKTRTIKYGVRAFEYAAPNLFNYLPGHVRLSTTYDTFKGILKTHLFQAAFGVIEQRTHACLIRSDYIVTVITHIYYYLHCCFFFSHCEAPLSSTGKGCYISLPL